jgi:hypothetical protein
MSLAPYPNLTFKIVIGHILARQTSILQITNTKQNQRRGFHQWKKYFAFFSEIRLS